MNHKPISFLAAFDADTTHWLRVLQQAMPSERLVLLQDMSYDERMLCDVAIVANPDPADLQQLPNLQWVHSVWAGVERLLAELYNTDLQIVRLVDPQLAHSMADAVLDVFLQEPLPASAWHWQHEQVTVLPHCSGPTDYQTASAIVADNIQRFRDCGAVPPAVDRALGY